MAAAKDISRRDRPTRALPRRMPRMAGFAPLAATLLIAACTAGTVMDVRPPLDVGTTAAVVPAPSPAPPPTPRLAPLPDEAPQPQPADVPPAASNDALYAAQLAAIAAPAEEPAMPVRQASVRMVDPPLPPVEPPVPQPAAPAVKAADPAPETVLAGYPRIEMQQITPRTMPAEEVACRRELKRLGVSYTDLPPINDGGACRIDWPVKVSALSGGIAMKPAATLNCRMAATFARWTRNELAPAARMRYLSGIRAIRQGSSYSCRRIAGSRTPSAHSQGNALDVMSIDLENGRNIDVTRPGFFAFRKRGLLNKVRAEGCDYFTTVLGPGYNRDHADHFHFDLMQRRSGRRACH